MQISKGHVQAFVAYTTWGVFPIYWKLLQHLSSFEIFLHRIVWSFVFFLALVLLSKKIKIASTIRLFKNHALMVLSLAALIGSNWVIYLYAVNNGQVLQGSLAYFMTPLMNIAFGAWIFKEKLSPGMKVATQIAGFGVLLLMLTNTTFPWIAISLALSFAIYGVIKKKTQVGGLESSFLENLVMVLPAATLAIFWRGQQTEPLQLLDYVLLIGGGAVTALPILLFSLSMRSVPLNHAGVLQFIAPTLQFIIGYFMYHEPVSTQKMVAFVLVWVGVALYIRDLNRQSRA